MKKYIEKTCYIDEDDNAIQLSLVDTRDNYMYTNAFGTIGSIFITHDSISIYPTYDDADAKTISQKEQLLLKEMYELFGVKGYEFVSPEYHQKATEMIKNGILESHGYIFENNKEHESTESISKKHRK